MTHLMLAALVLVLSAPVSAATFVFTQTGSLPAPGSVAVSGSLSLTDVGFANGISISRTNLSEQANWLALGLEHFAFSATATRSNLPGLVSDTFQFDLSQFVQILPLNFQFPITWSLRLTSAPGAAPTGEIRYNTPESDLTLVLNGAASSAHFNTDRPVQDCNRDGGCRATGDFAQGSSVPEPGTLALFASALIGYVARRRVRISREDSRTGS